MTRAEKADQLRVIAQERILVKDGPYGTAIQNYKLDEAGYRGGRAFELDQKGNNDLLNLTRPDVVGAICNAYVDSGADLLATNTFNANAISLGDYGIPGHEWQHLRIEQLDAANTALPPAYVKNMLGWNRKALRVTLVATDADGPRVAATEALCALACGKK